MLFVGLLLIAAWALAVLFALSRIEALLREVRDQTKVFGSFSEEFERRARLDGTTRAVWEREGRNRARRSDAREDEVRDEEAS